MKHLEPSHDDVGCFYDQIDEATRLEAEDPIEYAITLRYLQRYIPDPVTVADMGVGGGQYSIFPYAPETLHQDDAGYLTLDQTRGRMDTLQKRRVACRESGDRSDQRVSAHPGRRIQ